MLYYVVSLLSQIYCDGPILQAVQDARLFSDSKYFVDMPLKQDPSFFKFLNLNCFKLQHFVTFMN
jgi:hypothetical protein